MHCYTHLGDILYKIDDCQYINLTDFSIVTVAYGRLYEITNDFHKVIIAESLYIEYPIELKYYSPSPDDQRLIINANPKYYTTKLYNYPMTVEFTNSRIHICHISIRSIDYHQYDGLNKLLVSLLNYAGRMPIIECRKIKRQPQHFES